MPLEKEDIDQIQGLLGEQLKGISESLGGLLAKELKGVNDRFKAFDEKIGGVAAGLESFKSELPGTIKSQFDSTLEELGEEVQAEEKTAPANNQQSAASQQGGQQADLESMLNERLKAAMQDLAKEQKKDAEKWQNRVKQAEELLEQERKTRIETQRQNRLNDIQSKALQALSGKVIPGKEQRALKAAIDEGVITLITDENGDPVDYKLKGKDKYGEEVLHGFDNTEYLSEVLQTQFNEYLPARPGTGTGASPSTSYTPARPQILTEGITAQDLLPIAEDEQKFKTALAELEQAIKAPT